MCEAAERFTYFYAGKFLGSCLWRLLAARYAPDMRRQRLAELLRADIPAGAEAWLARELPAFAGFVGSIPEDCRTIFFGAAAETAGVILERPSNPVGFQVREQARQRRNRKRAERRARRRRLDSRDQLA
jgi:hypothetical protein